MNKIKVKNNKHTNLIYELLKKAKETGSLAKGILETTRAVEKRTAKLVVIAEDVKPKKLISHLPNLCKYRNILFVWVPQKKRLGEIIGLEIPSTTCAIIDEGKSNELLERLASLNISIEKRGAERITYAGKEPVNLLNIDRVEKQIWFQKKFVDVILKKIKRGTLRIGKRIPAKLILPVFISETRQKATDVKIEVLIWFKYKDISKYPDVLEREWPNNLKELKKEMRKIYPNLKAESWITFYGFESVNINQNALSKIKKDETICRK